ncbi:MAG: ATP-binding protein [Gemmatimonadales bacterium]
MRNRFLRRMSIEVKLPVLVSALLVAVVGAVTWAGYLEVRRSSDQAARDRLTNVAGELVTQLSTQSRTLARALQHVGEDSALVRLVRSGIAADRAAAANVVRAAHLRDTSVIRVEVFDRQGTRFVLDTSAATPQLPAGITDDAAFAASIADSTGLGRLEAVGDTIVYPAAAAVTSNGAVLGYLIEWRRLSRDSAAKRRTSSLIGSDAALYIGSADGVWTDQLSRVDPPGTDLKNIDGPRRYVRAGHGRRLASISNVAGTPWMVAVEFPDSTVLAPARRFLGHAALIAALVSLIALTTVWFFSHRLTAPLTRLRVAADAMATGEHLIRVNERRGDEFGRLAAAFNAMAERVDQEATARNLSEEQWRLLFERSPHAMMVYSPDTLKFLAVNEAMARQYGWTIDELLDRTIEDIILPDDHDKIGGWIEDAKRSDGAARAYRHRRKDGTVIDVEINGHNTTFGGRPARMVVAQDVSSRKALEGQLRQAQKMEAIGRLAGGVAHDFNNILLVISAYAEMMQTNLPPDDPQRRDCGEMIDAVSRGRSLTRQLLAFSRQQVLQPVVLDPNAAITGVQKMLGRVIGEDIEILMRLDPNVGRIRVDPGQLEQVILNLAVNARDAMPKGGRLTLTTANKEIDESNAALHSLSQAGEFVFISVSDTGTGMTPEIRARIFDPFFTTKEPGRGTGLGLATVYGIVTQSGGSVTVYSDPGRGTTFRIYLPMVDDEAVVQRPAEPSRPGGTETVLLVEDEVSVRAAAAAMLKRLGYNVLVADTPEHALQIAADAGDGLHLVITDEVMPKMNGRTLIARLRAERPELDALLMSGYTGDMMADNGVLDPSVSYLEKPFSVSDLANKVREALAGSVSGSALG